MDDSRYLKRWRYCFDHFDSHESLQEELQEALSLCRQCLVLLSRATGHPFEFQNWMGRLDSAGTCQETLFAALALFLKHLLYLSRDMMDRSTSLEMLDHYHLLELYETTSWQHVRKEETWREVTKAVLLLCINLYKRIEKSKIDIYVRNKTGKTALLSQILNERNKEKLKILLVNGADVRAQDIHENTVLHYAAWIDCDIDIVKLLKEYGAGPVPDNLGQLPCHIAQKRGHAQLAEELCSSHNKGHLKEVTFHNDCTYLNAQEFIYLPNDDCIHKRFKYFHRDSISDLLNIAGVGQVIFDGEAGEIRSVISEIVTNICADIGQMDRIFSNEVFPAGSVNEETKVGLPDEFDFICRLDILSTMCEIDKTHQRSVSVRVKQEFWAELEGFQNESHHIKKGSIWHIFVDNLSRAVRKLDLYKYPNIILVQEEFIHKQINPNCMLTFQWSGCEYKNMKINVDIVPALQIPDWWPSKAFIENLPFDTTRVQQDGALLLFHGDYDIDYFTGEEPVFYLEIRPSAATAERAYMKQLPQIARDAYMVSKILCNERISPRVQLPDSTPILEKLQVTNSLTSYILKNCLFYVFADNTNHRGTCDKLCLHDYVCKIFEMVHNCCGKYLGSFVFKENDILSPKYEGDPCLDDRTQYRKFYSTLILLLLREPDNWISEIKDIILQCYREGSDVQIYKHL